MQSGGCCVFHRSIHFCLYFSVDPNGLAGTPKAIVLGGIPDMTTDPGPTIEFLPIFTFAKMVTFRPITQLSSITIGPKTCAFGYSFLKIQAPPSWVIKFTPSAIVT